VKLVQTWRKVVVLVTTLLALAPQDSKDAELGAHTITVTDLTLCQIALAPRITLIQSAPGPTEHVIYLFDDILGTIPEPDFEIVTDVVNTAHTLPEMELDCYAS